MCLVPGRPRGITRVEMVHFVVWLSLCASLVLANSNCTRLFNSGAYASDMVYC